MVSLTIMTPTKTNRRHFFLLEDGTDLRGLITNTLTEIGFHVSPNDEDQYDNGSAQVSIAEPSQDKDQSDGEYTQMSIAETSEDEDRNFLGGTILPTSNMIEKYRGYLSLSNDFSKLSRYSQYAFKAGLALIALIFVAGQVSLFNSLILPVILVIVGLLLFSTVTIIGSLYFDSASARVNYQVASQVYSKIIAKVSELDSTVTVHEINIRTSVWNRRIRDYLPRPFLDKLWQLNLGQVDAFYWNPKGELNLSPYTWTTK